MDEKTRAELVEWLDPEGVWTSQELLDEHPSMSYLIAYTCQSLWMSGGEFAGAHWFDDDADEYAEEVARIIAEHILTAVVKNDTFGEYKDVMCRHLMGVLAKELLNG